MPKSNSIVGYLFLASLFLIPFTAVAHPGKDGHGKGACKADVQQYCSQVTPGDGKILACLKENQAKLQPACREKLPKWEKFQAMKQTCKADREKLCPQGTREEVRACMKQKHDQLSASCKKAVDEIKAMKKANTTASHWDHLIRTVS